MFTITPIVVSTLVSMVVFAVIAVLAWRRGQGLAGYYFAMMATCNTFWTAMVALGYGAVSIPLKVLFATLDAWGYIAALSFLLLFALSFAGHERIVEQKWLKAIVVFYGISNLLLVSTNPWHGLYWSDFIPQPDNVILFVHGPAFTYTLFTDYGLALTVLAIFIVGSFRGSNIMKRQARWLVAALLTLIFLNVAYHTDIANLPGVDWTVVTSSIFGLMMLWALYGDKLLEVTPIARNKLINNLSDGMIALDLKDRVVDVNRSAIQILGVAEDALLGNRLEGAFPRFGPELREAPEKEVKFELNLNDQRFYEALISPIYDEWPKGLVGRLIILRDITDRKQNELRLLQLHKAVEQSPVSVVITDIHGNIEYINPHFMHLTGYELHEVIGKNPRVIQSVETSPDAYEKMWKTIQSGRVWRGELLNKKKNGELYWEVEIVAPVIDANGDVVNYISIKEDITAQKEADAKLHDAYARLEAQMSEIQALQTDLREQAIRDPLTKLHNRHYLKETLSRELSRAMRERYPITFMMLDIDHFKDVNDAYGHAAGDFVLREVADHLSEFTRTGDIICRYGGEEFLVVFPNTKEEDAFLIADRLRAAIQESKIYADRKMISITVSSGIAEFPTHGQYEALVLEAADKALYHAKHNGRNQVVLWSKIKAPF